jgi:hypothetical protein
LELLGLFWVCWGFPVPECLVWVICALRLYPDDFIGFGIIKVYIEVRCVEDGSRGAIWVEFELENVE